MYKKGLNKTLKISIGLQFNIVFRFENYLILLIYILAWVN